MEANDAYVYKGKGMAYGNVVRVRIHRSVKVIRRSAFAYCRQLRSVEFAGGPLVIENRAFFYCTSLESIIFSSPSSCVAEIGKDAFEYCSSLVSVQFPEGLVRINEGAFRNCLSLESIQLPSTLTEIGECAFIYCTSLVSSQLHEGLQKIGDYAFYSCSSLESFQLPSTVTKIGKYALGDCPNLGSVELHEDLETIGVDAFIHCPSLERFHFTHLSKHVDTMNLDEQRETNLNNKIGEISVAAKGGGEDWATCKESLERVHEVLTYWELKEPTTILELALWKAKIRDEGQRPQEGEGTDSEGGQQVVGDGSHMLSHNECRIKSGADVVMKNTLKYFTHSLDW